MEILGIGIVAGEKLGMLWRWISKMQKLDFAIQAAFAKLGIVYDRLAEMLIWLETGQSLLKGWCAIGTAIDWTGGGGGGGEGGGGEGEGGGGLVVE